MMAVSACRRQSVACVRQRREQDAPEVLLSLASAVARCAFGAVRDWSAPSCVLPGLRVCCCAACGGARARGAAPAGARLLAPAALGMAWLTLEPRARAGLEEEEPMLERGVGGRRRRSGVRMSASHVEQARISQRPTSRARPAGHAARGRSPHRRLFCP
jgi:hypothetical protein